MKKILGLLLIATLAGTTITVTKASSAESNGCTDTVKNVELQDMNNKSVFCSDNNVSNVGRFGRLATSVGIQNGTWQFWSRPNFQGDSVVVESDTFTRLGNLSNRVASFRRISP